MTTNTTCNECGGTMQEGLIGALWFEGKPAEGFWEGLKMEDRTQYSISAFRCERCGFL